MKVLIDIDEKRIQALAAIGAARGNKPRTELIDEALDSYINTHKVLPASVFGLLAANKVDGVEYQRKARKEWDEQ
ncbi:CopG family transcriptional regulator [Undibacterium pigrum]|nr:CopG family transcriptional regulator [Undibacterium pigrum]